MINTVLHFLLDLTAVGPVLGAARRSRSLLIVVAHRRHQRAEHQEHEEHGKTALNPGSPPVLNLRMFRMSFPAFNPRKSRITPFGQNSTKQQKTRCFAEDILRYSQIFLDQF